MRRSTPRSTGDAETPRAVAWSNLGAPIRTVRDVNTTRVRTSITAIVAAAVAVAASGSSAASRPVLRRRRYRAVADDHLSAAIQEIIDASLVPGAIDWNCCGVDLPATGVIVGVRVPGQPDILLAAGTYLDDGTALEPTASFPTANLGYSIVAEIGMKLVADGTLDPEATIDAWLPDAPNAERITVGMLIDATHGWGDYGDVLGQNVTADLERHWTSSEAVATLVDVAPAAEPGTFVGDGVGTGMLALGYIAEQVTGTSLADLVTSTITEPAGLDDSLLSDGSDLPDNYQHGRFFVEGAPTHSTAESPLTAYFTYAPAEDAFVSTVPDLLDLLDTWVDGTWRPGATPPTPAAFPDRPPARRRIRRRPSPLPRPRRPLHRILPVPTDERRQHRRRHRPQTGDVRHRRPPVPLPRRRHLDRAPLQQQHLGRPQPDRDSPRRHPSHRRSIHLTSPRSLRRWTMSCSPFLLCPRSGDVPVAAGRCGGRRDERRHGTGCGRSRDSAARRAVGRGEPRRVGCPLVAVGGEHARGGQSELRHHR